MMRKIFLILICLILLPPAWANEELYGEISNDEQPDFVQEQQMEPQDEISLFSPEEKDNNASPLSVYKGEKRPVLKCGVKFQDEQDSTTKLSKNGSTIVISHPGRKGLGELLFGNVSSGLPVNNDAGGFWGYHKGRFTVVNIFDRNEYKKEFARNGMSVEPEFQLTKNLKVKTSYRQVADQKGYTQGMALEYGKTDSRFKNVNNLKFEIRATTTIKPDSDSVKRFGFNTRYYF